MNIFIEKSDKKNYQKTYLLNIILSEEATVDYQSISFDHLDRKEIYDSCQILSGMHSQDHFIYKVRRLRNSRTIEDSKIDHSPVWVKRLY